MIPIKLEISHFLSYRETAVLDFNGIHLACISGANGAGKSSVLDGITWALFGRSRSRSDDDLVNRLAALEDKSAVVRFTFDLEGTIYRVTRQKRKGKSTSLELQISTGEAAWKTLTEGKLRQTQAAIENLLRMNYDTFINASFLLQGKADEFTTKTPNRRKEILADLIGLAVWDEYKAMAAGQRKEEEGQVALLEGQLGDIESELAQESEREAALAAALAAQTAVSERLADKEALLQQLRRAEAAVQQQKQLVQNLADNLARAERQLAGLQQTAQQRQAEQDQQSAILAQAEEIEADFAAWQQAEAMAQTWRAKADEYNRLMQAKEPHNLAVMREKTSLEQRQQTLQKQAQQVADAETERAALQAQLEAAQTRLDSLSAQMTAVAEWQKEQAAALAEKQTLESAQPALREEFKRQKERINQLETETGGQCPLCGQPLTEAHRKKVLAQLQAEQQEREKMGRTNNERIDALGVKLADLETQLKQAAQLERSQRGQRDQQARLEAQLAEMDRLLATWAEEGEKALAEVNRRLEGGDYTAEAQEALAALDEQVAGLAYDAAGHQAAQKALDDLAEVPERHQQLKRAEAAAKPLADSLADLGKQITEQEEGITDLKQQHETAVAELEKLTADGGDLKRVEDEVFRLREEAAAANRRVGAVQQRLDVLDDLRQRREQLLATRDGSWRRIQRLKLLEKACGPEGVQALLIEQVLPDIEEHANELLQRLTSGEMRVNFETQRQLKSRDALAETLDIRIIDNAGERPYDNYSGGEQFRVNFAIRLALSQLLAKRAGARLQTLVIDEGFGSQDPNGRQRLVEAINTIQDDFARILVITHIDELRDAFPARIDVEKRPSGSIITVM
jgi:exonuclease SbcC